MKAWGRRAEISGAQLNRSVNESGTHDRRKQISSQAMKIAYFTHQYPAVSHTFIRREISALEELGTSISRFALRSDDNLVDVDDIEEHKKTQYILRAGLGQIAFACIVQFR